MSSQRKIINIAVSAHSREELKEVYNPAFTDSKMAFEAMNGILYINF
jgi:hypothetical protein